MDEFSDNSRSNKLGIFRHDFLDQDDPHELEDRAKLKAKIAEDMEMDRKSQKVLERPEYNKPSTSSSTKMVETQQKQQETVANVEVDNELIVTVPPSFSDHYPLISKGEDSDPVVRERRNKVLEMTKHAWNNYVRYAWGKNELKPISKRGHTGSVFGSASAGMTIVDGLDTLYIMGLHEEFKQGRAWIQENLNFDDLVGDYSVFETNIRYVGGLLTCYSFTGDTMFRDKAEYIAKKLLPAFQTPTGIPYGLINFKSGTSKNYAWASGGASILSEFGTLHLEFTYLSDVTGNPIYREKVETIRNVVQGMEKPKGLYPNYLNPKTGKWGQHHMSMGAMGDSFYEYLLKAWIQSGKQDTEARDMYDAAIEAAIQHMLQTSRGGLMYFSDLKFDRAEHKMDHLACFSGGLLALGAKVEQSPMSPRHMDIAAGITNTCHESYSRTNTKLGPENFRFTDAVEAKAIRTTEKHYLLRPEVIESYFYMWRLTKDPKYREWGWEAVQALEKYCRTPGGYSGLKNVYQDDPLKDDVQQSYFLAETLKYLYLLFSDDSLISLDEWVYNTEAHPLPIKGVNPYYREHSNAAY